MVSRTLASALKKAKNLGRRGDTMLAHINPKEAQVLKSLGGSGTINPHTGLPEFADDSSSSNQSPSYSGGNYSNYTGGSDLGGYSGSGNTTYSGGGGGGTTSSGNMGGYIGGGGGGGSMAAARAADRSSVYGYSSDPYSSNSYVMGSMDNATPYNPMGPAGLSGYMVRGVLDGASGFANALSAGAGKVASFGDTLSGIFSNAQPSISSLGNEVSQGLINASDALNQGLSTGYNYARDYINNALSPSAPQGPSYTQMAASGNPAPEYTSPSDFMTPSVPSWQALPNPTTPMGRLPDGTVVSPQAERDYWNQQQNTFGQQLFSDPMANVEGGSGNYMSNVPSAPAPTRAPMRDYIERQAASANVPSGTISGVGYSGPKGVNAPVGGMIPHLSQAAYEAGGGLTLDPAAVARISGRLGYTPVGLRTNNPGNILDGKFAQGQPGYIGSTTSKNGLTYATFSSPEYGVQAVESLISGPSYYGNGLQSINDIINRYAPVDQNNSAAANAAYKNYISDQLGVSKYTPLTQEQLGQMARAQLAFENGGDPFINAAPSVSYNGGPVSPSPVYSTPEPTQPSASQFVVAQSSVPDAPQVETAPSFAIETDKLIADIRQNVWGSGLYSDADIVNEIVKSGVGTVNPETGKIEVTASDENGDGVVNQQDVDTVIGKLQQDYKVDPSKYWTPIGPPTQTNVAANPMMANMGIAQPPESPDVPMFASTNVADVPAPVAPSGTLAHLGVYDAPIGVDPNVYASPLNLPAQPNTVLSKAINTVIGLTPLGLPNTIAGLFGSGVGDMVANAANVPMTAEEAQAAQERMFASSQGKGGGNFTQVASNTNVLDRVKSKARTAKRASERWKLDALAWGFSEEQLADREVADLIKQVYDLGFIPKTA